MKILQILEESNMGNSWFQFQQFRIDQHRSSMKICTDSCLFGAYIPVAGVNRILDLGAGTGLLGLMAAQRNAKADIYFVEPDTGSLEDLKLNLSRSPWESRLHWVAADLKEFASGNPQLFDLVICNPPFFVNHLGRKNRRENIAMHLTSQQWSEWCIQMVNLVKEGGQIWLLLPGTAAEKMIFPFKSLGFETVEYFDLIQNGKLWRTITGLKMGVGGTHKKAWLEIRKPDGSLSDQARFMMKDFYLVDPINPVG